MSTVIITGDPLTAAEVIDVAHRRATVEVGPDVATRMEETRRIVAGSWRGARPCTGLPQGSVHSHPPG